MKINFKTFSDTNSLFIIRGADLTSEQKNCLTWKIDVDFSIAGPRRALIKKSNIDLKFKVHPLVGKTPPDVTGRVRNFDAEEEWVGIEIFGTADIELPDANDLNRLDAWPISIKMGENKKVKLSQNTSFNWAMEGRLDFFK